MKHDSIALLKSIASIRRTISAVSIALSLVFALAAFGVPLGTSFTYQGQLRRGGAAYTGTCNFQFSLWDAASAGTQKAGPLTINGVSVVTGLFTVTLDFGDPGETEDHFRGEARWLGTSVHCSGDGGFTPLDPRQPITAAPYALSLRPGATIRNITTGARGLDVIGGSLGVKGSTVQDFGIGLSGEAFTGSNSAGVFGTNSDGPGVWGRSTGTGSAIYGQADSTGLAGRFTGSVVVEGNLIVQGSLAKNAGSFRIDHPLDPANKFLSHSFVESPDMMNIYSGNITTDATGSATVTLPDYFVALNDDYRYQLTVLGQFAQAIVSREIAGNSFEIHTDKPDVKVSWQVMGNRRDAYAKEHPIVVEEFKPAEEQGLYLYPAGFGAGEEKQIGWRSRPATLPGAREAPAAGSSNPANN